MILRNDPLQGLFNGDIAIVLPVPLAQSPHTRSPDSRSSAIPDEGLEPGTLAACVQRGDGSLRWLPLVRLPEHESAYAMTIHKSQGSEFDAIAVVLPATSSPLLTRELLYTGVTRARRHALLLAPAARVQEALDRPTARHSGLLARLADAQTASADLQAEHR